MPVTDVTTDKDNLSLTITAEFAAPVERVFEVYNDARQLEKIWGPPGWPATFVQHELSPGSRSLYYLTSPEGEKVGGYWDITTVDAPNGFSFEDGFADGESLTPNTEMPVSTSDYRFSASGQGTRVTAVSTYASAEALQQVLDMGAVEGATAAINQIDELLAS